MMTLHLKSIEIIKGNLDKNLPGCGQLSPGTSSSPTQLLSKSTVNNLNAKVSLVGRGFNVAQGGQMKGRKCAQHCIAGESAAPTSQAQVARAGVRCVGRR